MLMPVVADAGSLVEVLVSPSSSANCTWTGNLNNFYINETPAGFGCPDALLNSSPELPRSPSHLGFLYFSRLAYL